MINRMTSKTKKDRPPVTKARKIYNAISTAVVALIFVLLIAVVIFMVVQRKNGGDTNIFGYYFYAVVTDSMEDTICRGDVIISKKVDDVNSLKIGDIITFIAPSGTLRGHNETHRIVDIKYVDGNVDYFVTKGDNSPKEDDWQLKPSAVKAVYVKTSAFIGGLKEFLSHWYGYVVLIVLPLCIVGVIFIVGFVKDRAEYELSKEGAKVTDGTAASLDNLSDEDKKKLLSEYLDKKGEEQHAESQCDTDDKDGQKADKEDK